MIEEGKRQSDQLIENARREAEVEKARKMEELRTQIVDTAISAAEKIIQDEIDPEVERKSLSSFVKEVISK